MVQSAAIFLIGIRSGSNLEGMGDLGHLPRDIVLIISKYVWATRRDPKWLEAYAYPAPAAREKNHGCFLS